MDHFVLEKDAPGSVVSFQIPSEAVADKLNRGETIAINYRHLYKRLTGRKRSAIALAASSLAGNDKTSLSLTSSAAAGSRHMMRSSNTFENVIDKLERKYYVSAPIDEGDSNSSGTRSTATGTPNSNAAITPAAAETENALPHNSEEGCNNDGEVRLKRKKKAVNDAYDYSDPFLDDSEAVQEYEGRLMAKRRKSGHKIQYMVSAGNVEGAEEEEVEDDDDEDDQVEMDQSPTTAAAAIVQAIKQPKKSASSSSNNAAAVASSSSAIAVSASASSAGAAAGLSSSSSTAAAAAAKPKQPPAPKPLWSPNPTVLTAMQQFKDVSATVGNLSKNAGMPVSLEGPLLHLDTVVMRHFTAKELAKVSGYYEFVQSCLGGAQFPIGRVKSTLTRLYARETARKAYEKLSGLIEVFKAEIAVNIRPCPEEKQPSYQGNAISTAANEDDLPVLPPSSTADALGSSTRYAYQFVWTTSFREKLLAIRAAAGDWLSLENAYRSKLTNLDKKGLDTKLTAVLDPTPEMNRILGEINDAFPAFCLHGDTAAMNRVLGM